MLANTFSGCNYSCKVTFARASTLKPLYMRLLKVLIDHPNGLRRHEALNITHGVVLSAVPNGWMIGPFNLLKGNGFAKFDRRGHHCYWYATPEGEAFYNHMRLLSQAA